ncbi:nuclear transport factor 2 family protein [Sphingomonas sp. RIT328]|uniref:nuclear transport factor 2 family protein n=1 Tax=Sphingomonas sp. RIT328 TaxID=1470591 RepID=UPI000450909F|nr:nuclear transport factor 2 family protein [Sphingomonas sp. RIT328]EZP50043.1 hypothetical protein BW41_03368 [Sphingomonas sp. RIT328]
MFFKAAAATYCLIAASSALCQVPPPPPLPGQDTLGRKLVEAIERKDVKAYADLLSDDVKVSEDGRQIASDKASWLSAYGKKLSANGVSFKIESGFTSTGRLLFIEYFNSAGSWGGEIPKDCCWSYDAVAYDVAGSKITAIYRLRGGSSKLEIDGASHK